MVHRGKRSKQAEVRRTARKYVLDNAFQDRIWAERICVTSRVEILDYCCQFSDDIQLSQLPQVIKGEVLTDSRGRGSFQKRMGGET